MRSAFLFTVLGAAVLSACSGADRTEGPVTQRFGVIPSNVSVVYNSVADEVTITNGSTSLVLDRVGSPSVPGFRTYLNSLGAVNYALYGRTGSGSGTLIVAVSPTASLGVAGAQFARTSDTEVPAAGGASYTGNYGGFVVRESNFDTEYTVRGDATLTADFEAGTISGSITNRSAANAPSVLFANLALEPATIADGAFSGDATGGQGVNGFNGFTYDGSYSGLLTGPQGSEVVGALFIRHENGVAGFVEIGGFVAD